MARRQEREWLKFWRPVRESNPCRRREREATYCSPTELSGMDSTLPHVKDLRERLLDSKYARIFGIASVDEYGIGEQPCRAITFAVYLNGLVKDFR